MLIINDRKHIILYDTCVIFFTIYVRGMKQSRNVGLCLCVSLLFWKNSHTVVTSAMPLWLRQPPPKTTNQSESRGHYQRIFPPSSLSMTWCHTLLRLSRCSRLPKWKTYSYSYFCLFQSFSLLATLYFFSIRIVKHHNRWCDSFGN